MVLLLKYHEKKYHTIITLVIPEALATTWEGKDVATQKIEWTTVPKFLAEHKGLVAKNLIYTAIADGNIRSIRIGKKLLIPANAFDLLAEAQAPA